MRYTKLQVENLMNMESYDQESFDKELLGERVAFLTEGISVALAAALVCAL